MPGNDPWTLTSQQNAGVLTYTLSLGEFPAGTTVLPSETDTLNQILFGAQTVTTPVAPGTGAPRDSLEVLRIYPGEGWLVFRQRSVRALRPANRKPALVRAVWRTVGVQWPAVFVGWFHEESRSDRLDEAKVYTTCLLPCMSHTGPVNEVMKPLLVVLELHEVLQRAVVPFDLPLGRLMTRRTPRRRSHILNLRRSSGV